LAQDAFDANASGRTHSAPHDKLRRALRHGADGLHTPAEYRTWRDAPRPVDFELRDRPLFPSRLWTVVCRYEICILCSMSGKNDFNAKEESTS
jgi:hypothetical protein